ncbi:MAG: hypothetical protein GY938_17280 [Ketobacter sp.]|nr:hypothetical protein [Ketobacter sp.]
MRLLPLVLGLIANCTIAQPDTIIGYAYDVGKSNLRYMETYASVYDTNGLLLQSSVQYTSPKKDILALKTLDYSNHPYAPDFTFDNRTANYIESIEWLDDNNVLVKRKDSGREWEEKIINIPEPAVADAGFDAFLKDQLAPLRQGQTLRFNFLNPARLDWFRFTATAIGNTSTTITVKVAPANTVLRWLVDPIMLTYQLPDELNRLPRLLHYSGLTNMSLDGQDPLVADIFYEYTTHQPKDHTKPIVMLF